MKKRLILIFALIVLSNLVLADNVTLYDPDGTTFTDTRTVEFTCNASALTDLDNIRLFFGNETSFAENQSVTVSGTDANVSFTIENISNGSYEWNCEANLANNSRIVADANKTFIVNFAETPSGPNTAPNLTQNISDLQWNKSNTTTIDLSDYFSDPDNDPLTFRADSVNHIGISIEGSQVTLIPDTGWSGNGTTKFYASDGQEETSSNIVFLNVIDPYAINWSAVSQPSNVTTTGIPVLTGAQPVESPFVLEAQSQVFSVTVTSTNPLNYTWYLDNQIIQGATSNSYSYTNPGAGTKTLNVTISDGINPELSYQWTIIASAPATTPTSTPKTVEGPEAVCGNKIREEGEDCSSCPQDVVCGPGKECVDGACVEESSGMGVIIGAVIGLIVLLVGALVIFKIIRKKTEKKEEPKIKPLTEIEAEKKTTEAKPEEKPAETKPEEKPAETKVEKTAIKEEKPVEKADPLLLDFIAKMRAKGKTDEEIKAKLKESGWTDEQIASGFK